MWSRIIKELWSHLPFTAAGAVSGIVVLVLMVWLWPAAVSEPNHDHDHHDDQAHYHDHSDHDHEHEHAVAQANDQDHHHGAAGTFFHMLHFAHIFFSAVVTAAMYRRYRANIALTIAVGYLGSIIFCSLSDIIVPFVGGAIMGIDMHFHLCAVSGWYILHPLAFAGVFIAFIRPITRFPHFGHVLLSTWASLFYLLSFGIANWLIWLPAIFVILLVAVWIPCCLSDIVVPLLVAGKDSEPVAAHEH